MTELRTLSKEIVEAAKEMVIAGHTEIATTPRDRFLQAAEKEMAKFERQEGISQEGACRSSGRAAPAGL
ncbi:hypothetical protein ACF1BQ_025000 [Bradyrhizobium sp. RDT10]